MTVQLLTLNANPERHSAQRYRRRNGRTNDIIMTTADHTAEQYDRLKSKYRNIKLNIRKSQARSVINTNYIAFVNQK